MQGCPVSDLRVVRLHAKAWMGENIERKRVRWRREESQMEEGGESDGRGGRRVSWRRREESQMEEEGGTHNGSLHWLILHFPRKGIPSSSQTPL